MDTNPATTVPSRHKKGMTESSMAMPSRLSDMVVELCMHIQYGVDQVGMTYRQYSTVCIPVQGWE